MSFLLILFYFFAQLPEQELPEAQQQDEHVLQRLEEQSHQEYVEQKNQSTMMLNKIFSRPQQGKLNEDEQRERRRVILNQ